DNCEHAAGRNRQIEVFECDLACTGIPERDVVKTDAFARTGRGNHRFFRRDYQRLQLEKLEEISKEQRILIKLPDVFQKRASQIQPLLKGLVEERQVAQRYDSTEGSRHHPDQSCAGYGPRGNTRQELRHALTPGQIDTLHPEPVPQILISLTKVTAQIEETDLGRCLSCRQEPVVIPRTALNRRRPDPELVMLDGMAEDDRKRWKCARQQRQRQPNPKPG